MFFEPVGTQYISNPIFIWHCDHDMLFRHSSHFFDGRDRILHMFNRLNRSHKLATIISVRQVIDTALYKLNSRISCFRAFDPSL